MKKIVKVANVKKGNSLRSRFPPCHSSDKREIISILSCFASSAVVMLCKEYCKTDRRSAQKTMKSLPSLYELCINAAVNGYIYGCKFCKKEFRALPNNVLFDFYYQVYMEKRLCLLAVEFSELEIFNRMLLVGHKRSKLLSSFQSLTDHGTTVTEDLLHSYNRLTATSEDPKTVIEIGLRLAAFLNEGAWFVQAIKFLEIVENYCKKQPEDLYILKRLLECYNSKIYADAVYCNFESAQKSYKAALNTINKLEMLNCPLNCAGIYTNFSLLFYIRSEYDEAYHWSQKALKLLSEELPPRLIVEVLRQASKACVIKRKFRQAGLLIQQAVSIASKLYKIDQHPHYSDTLLHYGFYLLTFDSVQESVQVYEEALEIKKKVFEKNNLHVAFAYEDLSYALYVMEYSSGRFYCASESIEKAIRIMERILPQDHLLIGSVKRVTALILEEIALDLYEGNDRKPQKEYFREAEQLHKGALALSYKAFGEKNVQTAKHYGNLGRLYQSMRQYEQAEKMHLRAIAIKEELLGKDDYEVGLSIGHLASLYNYHMQKYTEAEKLYERSIAINLNLFGKAYSGLEYDYRGLMHCYTKLVDTAKFNIYSSKMIEWKMLRSELKPVERKDELLPLKTVLERFFSLEQQ